MFWMIFCGMLLSTMLPASFNNREEIACTQNSVLTTQIDLLAALLLTYNAHHPFTQDQEIDLAIIDVQEILPLEALKKQLRVIRTSVGFFIHILSPRPGWPQNFLEQTGKPFFVGPDSIQSQQITGLLLPYRLGYTTSDGLLLLYMIQGERELIKLQVPPEIPIGSLVVLVTGI